MSKNIKWSIIKNKGGIALKDWLEKWNESHIFMRCDTLNEKAFSALPLGYHLRHCRKEELGLWKDFPFDDAQQAQQYRSFMDAYFMNTYAGKGELFFNTCLFLCDEHDIPLSTGFLWKQYDQFWTLHWIKTKKSYEGKGLGRAMLSAILQDAKTNNTPIYLHTHAGCERAIHLYTEFGFKILIEPEIIDQKPNQWRQALVYLREVMPKQYFWGLRLTMMSEEEWQIFREKEIK